MRKIVILIVSLFFLVMVISAVLFWVAASAAPGALTKIVSAIFGHSASAIPSSGGTDGAAFQKVTLVISGCTFAVSAISAVFTVLFAWRKDWREAKEFKLRVSQLEIQIAELKSKTPTAAA